MAEGFHVTTTVGTKAGEKTFAVHISHDDGHDIEEIVCVTCDTKDEADSISQQFQNLLDRILP